MKKILLMILLLIPCAHGFSSMAFWGRTGHRVTGEVAEKYLTEVTREKVSEILGGRTMALVANFADDIKSDERFESFDPWHYVNFPLDKSYTDQSPSSSGDIIMAIEKCIEVLKDENSEREDKEFYLKLLIHFMGDLHQPLHIGRAEDRGGNDIQVRWFSQGSNLHRVWDSEMIDHFGMSYTELSNNLPVINEEERDQIAEGDYLDWMKESRELTLKVYPSARVGEKLGYRYMYDHFDTVRWQLLKGGIRLANLLNTIFDPEAAKG